MTLFARFADESGKITQDYAKPKLFEPNKSNELSVFDVSDLSDKQACELGVQHVAKPKGRRLYGWGRLSCTEIIKAGLHIDRDDNPPGHANLVGWPEAVEDRKDKSQQIAKESRVIKMNSPAEKCMDCADKTYLSSF